MSWTKRQIIYQAFESIGMAEYAFDLTAEELQSALRQLEAMMAFWNSRGIRIGYAGQSTPDLDTDSGLPDNAIEAAYGNLALRIAPGFGKMVTNELKAWAHNAYKNLLSMSAKPPFEIQMPAGMPRGAGNKPYRSEDNFTQGPAENIDVGTDNILELD
jgi:hypothetical protein